MIGSDTMSFIRWHLIEHSRIRHLDKAPLTRERLRRTSSPSAVQPCHPLCGECSGWVKTGLKSLYPEEMQKITLDVDAETVAFFKEQAKRHGTKYQRMMREVLKGYAKRHA